MIDKILGKAISKDEYREYLKYIHYNPNSKEYVSTNGHFLLCQKTSDNNGSEPAFYDPKTLEKVDFDGSFPDYKKLFLSYSESVALNWDNKPVTVYKRKKRKQHCVDKIIYIDGYFFNAKYVKTIAQYFKKESVEILTNDCNSDLDRGLGCFQFKNAAGNKTALLMKMRVDRDFLPDYDDGEKFADWRSI